MLILVTSLLKTQCAQENYYTKYDPILHIDGSKVNIKNVTYIVGRGCVFIDKLSIGVRNRYGEQTPDPYKYELRVFECETRKNDYGVTYCIDNCFNPITTSVKGNRLNSETTTGDIHSPDWNISLTIDPDKKRATLLTDDLKAGKNIALKIEFSVVLSKGQKIVLMTKAYFYNTQKNRFEDITIIPEKQNNTLQFTNGTDSEKLKLSVQQSTLNTKKWYLNWKLLLCLVLLVLGLAAVGILLYIYFNRPACSKSKKI
ncbi:hypothetical protein CDIK_2884 [Cucumispora dikerogammari]|nr:hypothetical protein CDIK_2884 [Cucumispora dikerogammari]